MSGLDFLQLRPVSALGVPIVAVSGVANESQARECLRLGAADFMGKPVRLDRLNEVLTFLEPHAMTRAAELEGRPKSAALDARAAGDTPSLSEYNGREHDGDLIEVGAVRPEGALRGRPRPDTIGRAIFTPPDAGPPIEVIAILVRVEHGRPAFTFVRLAPDAERLRELILRAPV